MKDKWQIILSLKKYISRYKVRILFGFITLFLTVIFSVLHPRIMGLAIDSLRGTPDKSGLLKYTLLFLLVMLIQSVFRFFMRYILIGVSRKIEYDIRNDYFSHLLKLSQNFFNRVRTGDLMARATNDLNAVRGMLGPGILYSANTLLLFIMASVIMFSINVKLTLLALIPFPLIAISVNIIGKKIHSIFRKIQEQFSAMETKVQEVLSGIRIIKAYNREENEQKIFKDLNYEYVLRNKKLITLWSLFFPAMHFIGGVGILIILVYGGKQVIDNKITLGDFVAFTEYLLMLIWPMMALGWVINLFQRGTASLRRINKIINEKSHIEDYKKSYEITEITEGIEIKSLNFKYPDTDELVLNDINIKIPAGKSLAVLGKTGSGKTTLINLITRILEPPDNTVFIDGIDIKNIKLKNLREIIGLIPQEPFLFSDTIKENIKFGNKKADRERVNKAAETSGINKEIEEFPNKYDTILGERGINLSGGQKQRLTISRALIKDPEILIFDDALSSVDTSTEEKILSNLKKIKKGKTCIIVSHRISTLRQCDFIVVLKEGKIVEKGTHTELIKLKGLYTDIYNKQLITEELEII